MILLYRFSTVQELPNHGLHNKDGYSVVMILELMLLLLMVYFSSNFILGKKVEKRQTDTDRQTDRQANIDRQTDRQI